LRHRFSMLPPLTKGTPFEVMAPVPIPNYNWDFSNSSSRFYLCCNPETLQ
jgi:hypothetical protein